MGLPPATCPMRTPALTDRERRLAKKLLLDGIAYQNVQQLINTGRTPTINPGRLAGSANWDVEAASDDEVSRYKYEKSLVDLKSGLSPIDDERIFRAREAMISAVQIFNSPSILFKIEIFPVLSQIAWTYLLHEYYDLKGISITDANGNSLLLSQILNREDCPLNTDVKKNLLAVKTLRDSVEHTMLSSVGRLYWPLFQANCLNFDQTIRKLFGENAGLEQTLSLSLQFGKMQLNQLAHLQKYDLSPAIEAIDQQISQAIEETGNEGPSYKFKVNYTFEKATKGDSHIVFTENNKESEKLSNILTKKVVGDELWPYKPTAVLQKINEACDANFTSHDHQLAWKKFGVRPRNKAKKPDDCKKDFCYYHAAHRDYTYSDKWVDFLINIANNPDELKALRGFDPKQK
ncbi:DUF3644 domain-containing protein [Novosphingobium sp. G106]|uniref:DUF3644 domain-containing protein n=1 Tax=Novosphingobium sp. G106 TaxID=2849500 RepID=UPI001C2D401F|nr:DUF3644 domain-containing protein [Novosphingobium sp. G106]MBV1690832.1 DUF3644 domain-containing protein [Novosphingobium sp. G106]